MLSQADLASERAAVRRHSSPAAPGAAPISAGAGSRAWTAPLASSSDRRRSGLDRSLPPSAGFADIQSLHLAAEDVTPARVVTQHDRQWALPPDQDEPHVVLVEHLAPAWLEQGYLLVALDE